MVIPQKQTLKTGTGKQPPAVLVLGAYGLAGEAITKGLIQFTDARIMVAGRNSEKLQQLVNTVGSARITSRLFDVFNQPALKKACDETDLVINAIGPVSISGLEIARAVSDSGTPLIDLAVEQIHYQRLQQIEPSVKNHHTIIIPAAGLAPGFATLLMKHAIEKLSEIETMEMFYVQGRIPDPDSGLGSIMGAVLDPLFGSMTYRKNRYVEEKFGENIREEKMPEPFGLTKMLGISTIDTLLLPPVLGCANFQTYFAVGVEPPPGLDLIIRTLKPHKYPLSFWMISKFAKYTMRQSYRKALKEGKTTGGYIKVRATNSGQCWEAIASYHDGGTATAYLPVILTKKILSGKIQKKGIVPVTDIIDLTRMQHELDAMNCAIPVQENIVPIE